MFERYTEKARRVIFFARYEASQFGAPAIEPEHLLLGLMREDKTLTGRFFPRAQVSIESIRKEIEGRTLLREKISSRDAVTCVRCNPTRTHDRTLPASQRPSNSTPRAPNRRTSTEIQTGCVLNHSVMVMDKPSPAPS